MTQNTEGNNRESEEKSAKKLENLTRKIKNKSDDDDDDDDSE